MRPKASNPFVANDEMFLAFSIMCRESGIAASKRLKIQSPVTAADLDMAVAVRLTVFDNEVRHTSAKLIAYEVGKMLGGESGGSPTSPEPGVEIW